MNWVFPGSHPQWISPTLDPSSRPAPRDWPNRVSAAPFPILCGSVQHFPCYVQAQWVSPIWIPPSPNPSSMDWSPSPPERIGPPTHHVPSTMDQAIPSPLPSNPQWISPATKHPPPHVSTQWIGLHPTLRWDQDHPTPSPNHNGSAQAWTPLPAPPRVSSPMDQPKLDPSSPPTMSQTP